MILSHKFEYGYNEEGGRKWDAWLKEWTMTLKDKEMQL